MKTISVMLFNDMKRKSKDSFMIGYNIIFPIVMILLLGYLMAGSYGKEFTSYHYYSLVMVPFCVAMGVITVAYAGKDDAYRKTAIRILFSPISNGQIVISKLLSCTVAISLCNLLVLVFSILVLRLPVFDKLLPIFILLTSETFCITAFGLFIGLGMKNFIFIKNILNLPISVFGVLGGVFYPIGSLNPSLNFMFQLSPLTWINRSIFLYVYDDSLRLLWMISLINFIIGLSLTFITIKLFKKEEFIHGDFPGYEK